jgi:6-phosphogluconolactonase
VGGLVPGSAALRESRRLVVMAREEDPPRLTMTLNLINDARFVAIFATGSACAEVVRRCAARRAERAAMPVAGVAPADGVLRWYLDGSACDAEGGW